MGGDENVTYKAGPATLQVCSKLLNETFIGKINLSNDLTAYKDYTVTENIDVTVEIAPETGGSAEIRFIGDGSHTPTFTTMVASASSTAYDNTLGTVNKTVFYFDGTSTFYSITVLS